MIIDTDPGVDDAIAIALAAALPQIDLLALTAVFGNTHVTQSSRNARFLLDMLGKTVPVAEGAALPYGEATYEPSANVHGPEGFGDITDIPQIGANDPRSAAQMLVELAAAHPREITICALGPLTNIADALRLDPNFAQNIKRLVIMGGAFEVAGNISKTAEANIYHDPRAADEVFGAGLWMTMVGLNATLQTLLTPAEFTALAKDAPKIGGFIEHISEFYLKFYASVGITGGCPMHDAAAVLACTDPDRFTTEAHGIRVGLTGDDFGATLRDGSRKPVDVAMGIDATWATQLMLKAIGSLG